MCAMRFDHEKNLAVRPACVKLLLEAGADPSIADEGGETAFDFVDAKASPEAEAMAALLKLGN